MMYKGYNWMFWGTLLVIFNIQLGGLILFPDMVGYIIIALGVGYIVESNESPSARLAKLMAWTVIIGEGIRWILIGGYWDGGLLGQGLEIIFGILILVMRYSVLDVEKDSLQDIAEKQLWEKKQRSYLVLHTLALVAISFKMNFLFFWGAVGILTLTTEIYWLSTLYQLRKKYRVRGEDNNA